VLPPARSGARRRRLHERATNAAKYGALSTPSGKVDITWRRLPADAGSGIEILWSENGGPAVAKPQRRGFGSTVIERHVASSLDAEVELKFEPSGVTCRIAVPVTQFVGDR